MIRATIYILILSSFLSLIAYASDTTKLNPKGNNKVKTVEFHNINESQILELRDAVTSESIDPIIAQLKELSHNPSQPAYLVINSHGGDVEAAINLIQTIIGAKGETGLKTICIVDGKAESAAAYILSFCHESYATPTSSILFHRMTLTIRRPSDQLLTYSKFQIQWVKSFETQLAKQLGMSYEKYVDFRDKSLDIMAKDAVQFGFLNGLVPYFFTNKEPSNNPPPFLFPGMQ